MPPIRVLLAEDHPMFLEALANAVRDAEDLELVQACRDGTAALAGIRARRPDVAVLDLRMADLSAAGILEALVDDAADSRVLVLSAHLDGAEVVRCLELGAAGYVAKDATRPEILAAIRAAARGETVISAAVHGAMAGELRRRRPEPAAPQLLSAREQEILALLATGASAPEIGRHLFLSTGTVKSHLQHVYEKLGVSDRAAAVAEGMRRGLIS
jgi:two-component system nitrate/nitrite response regulator NarL